jgi:parallel beta helix pectate lyase-like protein
VTAPKNRAAGRPPFKRRFAYLAAAVLAIVFGVVRPRTVTAQSNGAAAGAIRAYSTISSIGVEWDVAGDADHDATATVAYRLVGSAAWRTALPLVRVDYNGSNMLAGSILFLSSNASYEIRLTLNDPDGGTAVQTVTVTTRPVPAMPVGGRSFHVVPGTGGGDGSFANPFRGVPAAETTAQPGDIFFVHAGSYGGRVTFTRPGTAAAYVAWISAGDGEALFAGIDVSASYVWLEGLTLRDQAYALMSKNAPTGVVVSRCSFFNNHYSIYLQRGGSHWYIADNTIVGDTPFSTESLDGEGIELNGYAVESYGHVVAHNSISNVADGISNGTYNVDVFGNDIFDTSDDGFEGDPGGANIRVWANRIHNAAHNGISYQPQNSSPWYIIRNQLVGFMEAPFKFRTTDRSVIAHNTIVMWSKMICCNDSHLLRSIVKNNLWVSVSGGQIWDFGSAVRDWRSDLNNDGFDWGASAAPFRYGAVTYSSLTALAAASGLETGGRRISRTACFTTFNVPGPAPVPVPAQHMTLTATCNAVDAGMILPNIDDDFVGTAPDLGAYELGLPLPIYGPRPRTAMQPPATPTNVRIIG